MNPRRHCLDTGCVDKECHVRSTKHFCPPHAAYAEWVERAQAMSRPLWSEWSSPQSASLIPFRVYDAAQAAAAAAADRRRKREAQSKQSATWRASIKGKGPAPTLAVDSWGRPRPGPGATRRPIYNNGYTVPASSRGTSHSATVEARTAISGTRFGTIRVTDSSQSYVGMDRSYGAAIRFSTSRATTLPSSPVGNSNAPAAAALSGPYAAAALKASAASESLAGSSSVSSSDSVSVTPTFRPANRFRVTTDVGPYAKLRMAAISNENIASDTPFPARRPTSQLTPSPTPAPTPVPTRPFALVLRVSPPVLLQLALLSSGIGSLVVFGCFRRCRGRPTTPQNFGVKHRACDDVTSHAAQHHPRNA